MSFMMLMTLCLFRIKKEIWIIFLNIVKWNSLKECWVVILLFDPLKINPNVMGILESSNPSMFLS